MDSYYLCCCLSVDQIEKVVNNLVLGEVFAAFPAFQLLADLNTHKNKCANKLPNTRTKAKRLFDDFYEIHFRMNHMILIIIKTL